jgi:hypothetical protein
MMLNYLAGELCYRLRRVLISEENAGEAKKLTSGPRILWILHGPPGLISGFTDPWKHIKITLLFPSIAKSGTIQSS